MQRSPHREFLNSQRPCSSLAPVSALPAATRSRAEAAFGNICAGASEREGVGLCESVSRGDLTKAFNDQQLEAKVLFAELDYDTSGGVTITEWLQWFAHLHSQEPGSADSKLDWIEERLSAPQAQRMSPQTHDVSPVTFAEMQMFAAGELQRQQQQRDETARPPAVDAGDAAVAGGRLASTRSRGTSTPLPPSPTPSPVVAAVQPLRQEETQPGVILPY